MTKAIKVGLVDRHMAVVQFVVATSDYLLAESTARDAMEISGLDPDDCPYVMLADIELIGPLHNGEQS